MSTKSDAQFFFSEVDAVSAIGEGLRTLGTSMGPSPGRISLASSALSRCSSLCLGGCPGPDSTKVHRRSSPIQALKPERLDVCGSLTAGRVARRSTVVAALALQQHRRTGLAHYSRRACCMRG